MILPLHCQTPLVFVIFFHRSPFSAAYGENYRSYFCRRVCVWSSVIYDSISSSFTPCRAANWTVGRRVRTRRLPSNISFSALLGVITSLSCDIIIYQHRTATCNNRLCLLSPRKQRADAITPLLHGSLRCSKYASTTIAIDCNIHCVHEKSNPLYTLS